MALLAEVESEVSPPKRRYQELWEKVINRAIRGDFRPVTIRVPQLKDHWFKTVRKAFYKEKDLDVLNREKWRGKVDRDKDNPDLIHFTVVPRNLTDRI